MITIKIADLPIAVDNRFGYIEAQAVEYLTDEKPVFTVSASDEEIDAEREISGTDYSRGYYESIIAYRKIAERLPDYDAFLFHGSVIEYKDKAYIITADSGVGKTTHTRIWMSEFSGEVSIVNGDKPIVRFIDGIPYACGTPWRGKENYGKNAMKELCGIAFLSRGDVNRAYQITPSDAAMRFMKQIYLPKKERASLAKTIILSDKLIKCVRLVQLECNMEPEAAHICRKALVE